MAHLNASAVTTAPEFVAKSVQEWLRQQGVQMRYIAPGCPWQNAYAESFHSRFRAECLDRQWFHTVREAAVVVEAWRRYYNQERLHSSLTMCHPMSSSTSGTWPSNSSPAVTPRFSQPKRLSYWVHTNLSCAFKSLSGIAVNRHLGRTGQPLWQRNYGDRVIRDKNELLRIRQYIVQHPLH
jgi:hypothetical protein